MKAVLDASALLAYLQDEPGSKTVEKVLEASCISAVNWSEVVQKSVSAGVETDGMREDLEAVGLKVQEFTATHADVAGRLWAKTKRFGLSLGDRACLSLAIALKLPVLTTDKTWKKPHLPLRITVIR
jgi:PIN domain nuclease of toxin-antitoxin system